MYLILCIILTIVALYITYGFGKACVRFDEVRYNLHMLIFIAFFFMAAGVCLGKV